MTTYRCAFCGTECAMLDRVTFRVRGYMLCDLGFCDEACASSWARIHVVLARAEAVRLRGWLRRIYTRVRGHGSRIAREALRGASLDEREGISDGNAT